MRVYIDKPGGVDVEDCRKVTLCLSDPLMRQTNQSSLYIRSIIPRPGASIKETGRF